MRAIDADKLKEVLERNFRHTGGALVLTQLIDAQDTVHPEPHWIPVTERPPQTGESVMICDAYGDICIGHRTMGGYYFPDFCEDKIKDVRAWCELPEPYREVTE